MQLLLNTSTDLKPTIPPNEWEGLKRTTPGHQQRINIATQDKVLAIRYPSANFSTSGYAAENCASELQVTARRFVRRSLTAHQGVSKLSQATHSRMVALNHSLERNIEWWLFNTTCIALRR